ncbi:MAG: hypothetical protein HFJ45_00495 [Clostridia bacterium]|nr:hypothetical protein [Clostridia bacterium]
MRRKVLLVAVLVFAILLQSVLPFTVVNASTSVEITLNSNLYKAVKSQLEKQNISASYIDANNKILISSDNLSKVTYLDLSNAGIKDLSGLSAFSNVTELNLTANELNEDSNLSELDSLSLTVLNLSSNKIESVSSINSFDSIKHADITNQQLTQKQIISVDISDESDHKKTAVVTLPDILLKDTGKINADWITSEIEGNATVDWTSISAGSTDLVLNIASGNGESYTAEKGLIKIVINVKDSASKLANTKMTFYYAIIDSEETGVVFEDENLYKAVKSQLTAGQKENEELESYDKDGTTLYRRAYDEARILVLDTNVVINKIPSLILNDKRVKDLTGIEEFVGLESELNVSYNYIDTIERVIDLAENKITKEEELQAKYSKALETLRTNKSNLDEQKELIKSLKEQIKTKTAELKKLTDAEQKINKQNEINDLYSKIADAEEKVRKYTELVNASEGKLYKIYEKEYKLVSLLPIEVNQVSVEKMLELDLDTVKGYAISILDRIAELEKVEALTAFETWAIQRELTSWGASNGLTFTTTKTVTKIDTDGNETTVQEEIENPISEFINTVKENPDFFTITDYEEIVYIFKCIDALSQVNNYCIIKRAETGTETCYIEEVLEMIKTELTSKDMDTSIYDLLVHDDKCDATSAEGEVAAYHLDIQDGFMQMHIGLADAGCVGAATADETYQIAGKLAAVTEEEIVAYVTLPRTQILNITDNKISSLEGLEILEELKGLYAYKNTLGNINNVKWESFKSLKDLNLGYNQLSDVKCLEKIETLETLNVCKNLLSGSFDFYLAGLKNLKAADFSTNAYSDISYLVNQYTFIAKGHKMEVSDFLTSDLAPDISFRYQTLSMDTTVVKTGDSITVDLPKIFAQFEQIDYARTSFGETSRNGTVLADGTAVVLITPAVGKYQGIVTVEGNNGFNDFTTTGIGFGTTCYINYTVVEEGGQGSQKPPVDPTDPPENPVDPENPDIEYGYTVSNGYVYVNKPETLLTDFVKTIVSLDKYDVTVKENKSETNIATGSVVAIDNKADGKNITILEVVVLGDVNGDGEIDALDSGLIRSTINDVYAPVGVYSASADVNRDGDVDTLDALLVLQYRADKISSFEK